MHKPQNEIDFAHIADAPNIVEVARKRMEEAGASLDLGHQLLIWLAGHTRWENPPVSIGVFGPPSVGKTTIVENALKFFDQKVVVKTNSLSPKALGYETDSLKNKYLYIGEYSGLDGPDGNTLLRGLIWDGQVTHMAVNKSKGGGNALQKNTVEGPTGLITTTTKTEMHPENQSRMLCLHVTVSSERTGRIMALQGECAAGHTNASVNYADFHAFEAWLHDQSHDVVIPFMPVLVRLLYTGDTQMTRNTVMLKQLTKASAIVHQRSRNIVDGVIEATLDDYRIVYDLAADVFAAAISESVPEDVQAAVNAYVSIATHRPEAKDGVPPKLVRNKLGWSGTAITRATQDAVDRGYLENAEPYARRLNKVVPTGEALPQPRRILPTPEELEEAINRTKAA
jgi:hypothetical protein